MGELVPLGTDPPTLCEQCDALSVCGLRRDALTAAQDLADEWARPVAIVMQCPGGKPVFEREPIFVVELE